MSEPDLAVMRAEVKRALGNLHQYAAPLRPFLDREVDAVMEIVSRLIEGSDPAPKEET